MSPEQAQKLRAPFPAEVIGKLPKPTKRDNPKGRCGECGGWHGIPAVHLDYVGHAAVTDRLLQVDPEWSWEPMATGPNGEPLFANGGLWIKLTVAGVTRPGFGDESNGKGTKEVIGDAIRNAAMRFGVALDLWAKEDLHASEGSDKRVDSTPAEKMPEEPAPRPGAAGGSLTEGAKDGAGGAGSQISDPSEAAASGTVTGTAPSASDPQKKKLNVLVGQLRDQGHITTIQLYTALGRDLRDFPEGEVHWSPLRDSLTKTEAGELIDRLERFQASVKAAESEGEKRGGVETATSSGDGDLPERAAGPVAARSSDSPSESAESSLFDEIARGEH